MKLRKTLFEKFRDRIIKRCDYYDKEINSYIVDMEDGYIIFHANHDNITRYFYSQQTFVALSGLRHNPKIYKDKLVLFEKGDSNKPVVEIMKQYKEMNKSLKSVL